MESFRGQDACKAFHDRGVWSIRTKLQIDRRTRDLAMFNLAIDSKLRGCDVVARSYPTGNPRSASANRSITQLIEGAQGRADKFLGQSAAERPVL